MQQLDSTLFALSSATRRVMIARLSSQGPARVTEIAEPFHMSLNAVSKHLKVLESAGLIRRTKEGRNHIITFEPLLLKEVVEWVHPYEKFWTQQLNKLEEHFKNKQKGKKT